VGALLCGVAGGGGGGLHAVQAAGRVVGGGGGSVVVDDVGVLYLLCSAWCAVFPYATLFRSLGAGVGLFGEDLVAGLVGGGGGDLAELQAGVLEGGGNGGPVLAGEVRDCHLGWRGGEAVGDGRAVRGPGAGLGGVLSELDADV